MCGIAGTFDFDGKQAQPELLQRMAHQLRHRGPDGRGVLVDGSVGLAHTRLSIIDLDRGHQPMHTRDHSFSVTFNGEIFNYIELREILVGLGHRFATNSDTEVILHAYEEFGEDCVQHFNGQWAFAIWDRPRQKLFLSRDRLGIRPLFHTRIGNTFMFASEIKALLAHPDLPRAIDPEALDQLFTLWATLPPRTILRDVHELAPGHNMSVRRNEIDTRQYWRVEYPDASEIPPAEQGRDRSEEDWAEELYALLESATQLRLRSDVPVGAYLSGGLDSSVTTALIDRTTNRHLQTFSVTFADKEFDESDYQNQLVEFFQTDHDSVRCEGDAVADVFPDVIWHTEKPVLRTAPAPLYLLSRLVHESGFKVVLTGEGSDELLGGYDIFKEAKVRRFSAAQPDSAFRALLFQRLYPYMPKLQSQSPANRAAFFRVRGDDLASPFFSHLPRWGLTSQLKRLFSPGLRTELESHDVEDDVRALLPDDYARWAPFCQAQFLETSILMPGYILSSQGDRMAMANSVEGRFPFLDHRLAEFAARIPPRLKMKALNEKYLLKRATRKLVPANVRTRKKQPYRAPDAASFFDFETGDARSDFVDELLSTEKLLASGLFNPRAVQGLAKKAREGRAIGVKDNMGLVGVLSTQLVVEHFVRGTFASDGGVAECPTVRLPDKIGGNFLQT